MIGAQALVEAAKKELGETGIQQTPVRVSCPSCGVFLVSVFVVPNLVQCRCGKCKSDIVVLVARDGDVLAAQNKK